MKKNSFFVLAIVLVLSMVLGSLQLVLRKLRSVPKNFTESSDFR